MHCKIIHKYGKRVVSINESKLIKELDVLLTIEGFLLNSKCLNSSPYGNGSANTYVALIHLLLVNGDVSASITPVSLLDA